jgi:ATP-dependent DNA helicase PIF1
MRSCQYIVIDEKSMVSLKLLAYIDRRLKQIRLNAAEKSFGGLNIILFGDSFQLPPVIEKALYSDAPRGNEYVRTGRKLYLSFNRTVELDVIMRQQDQSADQVAFCETLDGLRNNQVQVEHWRTLMKRTQQQLSRLEVTTFDSALRIYGKSVEVKAYNHGKIRDLGEPVLDITAGHSPDAAEARKASYEDAGNLHGTLALCISARV